MSGRNKSSKKPQVTGSSPSSVASSSSSSYTPRIDLSIEELLTNSRLKYYKDDPKTGTIVKDHSLKKNIAIIAGVGIDHFPDPMGYVGDGMLDAAICKEHVTLEEVKELVNHIAGDHGCILIAKGGDGNAQVFEDVEKLMSRDKVRVYIVRDDCSNPEEDMNARTGLGGSILLYKIAGAAVQDTSIPFDGVCDIVRKASEEIFTIGVALSDMPPSLSSKMRFGVGRGNELGVFRDRVPAEEVVHYVIDQILEQVTGFASSDRTILLVNGLGNTHPQQLEVLAQYALCRLNDKVKRPEVVFVGAFSTSVDLKGFSISVMKVSGVAIQLLKSNADAPYWTNSSFGMTKNPRTIRRPQTVDCFQMLRQYFKNTVQVQTLPEKNNEEILEYKKHNLTLRQLLYSNEFWHSKDSPTKTYYAFVLLQEILRGLLDKIDELDRRGVYRRSLFSFDNIGYEGDDYLNPIIIAIGKTNTADTASVYYDVLYDLIDEAKEMVNMKEDEQSPELKDFLSSLKNLSNPVGADLDWNKERIRHHLFLYSAKERVQFVKDVRDNSRGDLRRTLISSLQSVHDDANRDFRNEIQPDPADPVKNAIYNVFTTRIDGVSLSVEDAKAQLYKNATMDTQARLMRNVFIHAKEQNLSDVELLDYLEVKFPNFMFTLFTGLGTNVRHFWL